MLLSVCPCMIMDPAAVAEYIPADFPGFDLVIIDEGSQMPAYDAMIPISRGRRCMIFGDEKQLQPMDEFRRRLEEEQELGVGIESILTAAYTTSMPRKMLRTHYRSENESLIAFFDQKFYNDDIVTFPACDTSVTGVSYEYVKDGIYEKNGRKVNEKEARRVVEKIAEVYGELSCDTELTVGVITLNIHQRDLIKSLLLEETRENSTLGMKIDELVDVVNLESCQGKEWDYVILSPGFGYDESGKFNMNFGALNREYGSNRLNVMITRAKKKMFVITSMEPHMLADAREGGVRYFRDFLLYARGDLVLDSRIKNSEKRKKGLADSVAKALEKEGLKVHVNIGSSDYKVDIGVVSKEHPKQYAVGILLDHFRDGRDIHDREVVYPESLARKGWKIYQLRELNWYNDPRREIRQIVKMMEE